MIYFVFQTRRFIQSIVVLFCIITLSAGTGFAQTGWSQPFQNGVVSTADLYASEVGRDILEKGGNAVDAAIAIQFTLAVTMPRAGNIGGGGFMVLHLADGTTRTLDFREKAPARAKRDMFLDEQGEYTPQKSRIGGLATGVPGTVDGMINALERYGTLPLEVIMEQAVRFAEEGYPLRYSHARSLNRASEQLEQFDSSKRIFLKEDGSEWKAGDLFVQPELAETLKEISRRGRDGFYSGAVARMITDQVEKAGGIISLRDLRNYKSTWREPIRTQFQEYELIMMPPPSSGGVVIKQVLDMIGPHLESPPRFHSAGYIHLLTEAFRRAFADRNYYLGDPGFVAIPMDELMDNDYLAERMESYHPMHATDSSQLKEGIIPGYHESDETTHFSVIDADGNAVAVTTTLNGSFGSFVTVDGAGFLLNNEMDDFSSKPGEPNMFGLIGAEANSIEPGKRMLSSMSPTVVLKNGKPVMALGASGGPRIITATLQTFLNLALHGMNPQQAVTAPRFHHQWLPDRLFIESFTLQAETKSVLEERGHQLAENQMIGIVHLVFRDDDGYRYGAADPRADGHVSGY